MSKKGKKGKIEKKFQKFEVLGNMSEMRLTGYNS